MLMVVFDLGWRCEPAGYGSVRHRVELPDFAADTPTPTLRLSGGCEMSAIHVNSGYCLCRWVGGV